MRKNRITLKMERIHGTATPENVDNLFKENISRQEVLEVCLVPFDLPIARCDINGFNSS
jgi:hypothetical protein